MIKLFFKNMPNVTICVFVSIYWVLPLNGFCDVQKNELTNNTPALTQYLPFGSSGITEIYSFTSIPRIPGYPIADSQAVSIPLMVSAHFSSYSVALTSPFRVYSTKRVGNIGLSLSKALDSKNEFNLKGSLSIPTDIQHIYRGEKIIYVGWTDQIKSDMISANFSLHMLKDRERWATLLGVDYTSGLWYKGQNVDWIWARQGFTTYKNNRRPVVSDILNLKAVGVIKRNHVHHTFYVRYSMPVKSTNYIKLYGVGYINEFEIGSDNRDSAEAFIRGQAPSLSRANIIDERIDPNDSSKIFLYQYNFTRKIKTWPTLALGYGMEILNSLIPVYWAFSIQLDFNHENRIDFQRAFYKISFSLFQFKMAR